MVNPTKAVSVSEKGHNGRKSLKKRSSKRGFPKSSKKATKNLAAIEKTLMEKDEEKNPSEPKPGPSLFSVNPDMWWYIFMKSAGDEYRWTFLERVSEIWTLWRDQKLELLRKFSLQTLFKCFMFRGYFPLPEVRYKVLIERKRMEPEILGQREQKVIFEIILTILPDADESQLKKLWENFERGCTDLFFEEE